MSFNDSATLSPQTMQMKECSSTSTLLGLVCYNQAIEQQLQQHLTQPRM